MPRKKKSDESGALSKDSREVRERAVEDVRGEGTDARGGKAPAICPFIARSKEERIEAVKRAMEKTGLQDFDGCLTSDESPIPEPKNCEGRQTSLVKHNESPIARLGVRDGERAIRRVMGNKKLVERTVRRFNKLIKDQMKRDEKAKAAAAVKRIERKKQRQIAKNLLAKGVMSIEEIAECVELSVRDVRAVAVGGVCRNGRTNS